MYVLVTQLCPTLCDTMDCSPRGSMDFSGQEYWSSLPFPSAGDLPDPGSNPGLLHCRRFFTTEPPEKPLKLIYIYNSYILLYNNIYVTQSLCCTAETNVTLSINYTSIK